MANKRLAYLLLLPSLSFADGLPFKNAADIPAPAKGGAVMVGNTANNMATGTNSLHVIPANDNGADKPKTKWLAPKKAKPALPALGSPDKPFKVAGQLKPQLVRLDENENQVVYISNQLPNRIATPFKSPSVLGFDGIDYKIVGQDIYVLSSKTEPIGIYIREDESISAASQVASLTLVPQSLPGQNITLVFDKPIRYADKKESTASDYDDAIRIVFRDVVQGRIPNGYSEGTLNYGIARIGCAMATPKKMFAGGEQDIYQYTAENVCEKPIELTEQSFYHEGVRAVAFFPNIRLAPHQTTSVTILADKPMEEQPR